MGGLPPDATATIAAEGLVAFGSTTPFALKPYLDDATVDASKASQSTDALIVPTVTLGANAIATAFAIGGKTGASANPLGVLICVDNGPASGLLATCTQ